MALERIQKILSAAGVCSRREAEELIIEGRVKINGRVAELGDKADPEDDTIKVGGRLIRVAAGVKKLYIVLNKPRGYVSTTNDPEGRQTVMDLLGDVGTRVYPVGRLDYDTEGLLVFTNDGEFANAMTHPSREVPKTYDVKVQGILTESELERLKRGVRLEDGMTAPAQLRKKGLVDKNSWVEITIHEGRNRQVRRMCEAVGHRVQKLKRIKFGPVDLKGTPLGSYRELTPSEVNGLMKAAGFEGEKKPKTSVPKPQRKTEAPAGMGTKKPALSKPGGRTVLSSGKGRRASGPAKPR